MNIKEYIESGILEQFVLGNTSEEESRHIVELSKSHPEINAEIEEIEAALFSYADTLKQSPPAHLKNKILDLTDSKATLRVAADAPRPSEARVQPRIGMRTNALLVAASLLLLGMSIVGNVWLYGKWKRSEVELANLSSKNNSLVENEKVQQARYAEVSSQLGILLNPGIKAVKLKGLALMPDALATIYWDAGKKEVYLNASRLPAVSEEEQYQLWAIVDSKPVDAGVFVVEDALKGMVKMKDADKVTAFAITIEKKGGSPVPTLEKMVLMGAVI